MTQDNLGSFDQNAALLAKPYLKADLAVKVREVLDRSAR
jgi:hypothetical protein